MDCTRCCGNCRNAMPIENRGETLLVCPCRQDRPGRCTVVEPEGTCREFAQRVQPGQSSDENTRLIPLVNIDGLSAMVDAADYEWLSRYRWFVVGCHGCLYACTYCKGRTCLMHRMIMNPPKGMLVDHKNLYGLDNHRANLRNATHQQNCVNHGRAPGVSGFRGVTPNGDKWQAKIWDHGKRRHLGIFDDPAEAARAWDRKAIELYGEYARLNFPEEAGRRSVSLQGVIRMRCAVGASGLAVTRCPFEDPSANAVCRCHPDVEARRRDCLMAGRKVASVACFPFFGFFRVFRLSVLVDVAFSMASRCLAWGWDAATPRRAPYGSLRRAGTLGLRRGVSWQGQPAVACCTPEALRTTHDGTKAPRPAPWEHGPRVCAALPWTPLWARGPPESPFTACFCGPWARRPPNRKS